MPKIISLYDVLEPLKRALLASRDVIISSQICVSKLQRFFTLGDGCWLPIEMILASRKRCDLKTQKRCDFYSAAQKIASDFSAISSAIFWRFFGDFCGKTCDLVLCDLKTQRFFCDCDFLLWDAKEMMYVFLFAW